MREGTEWAIVRCDEAIAAQSDELRWLLAGAIENLYCLYDDHANAVCNFGERLSNGGKYFINLVNC